MKTTELNTLYLNFRSGCQASGNRLMRGLFPKVFKFMIKRGLNDVDAEDVAQTVMAKVIEKSATFDASRSFAPWFWVICRNELINHFRTSQVKNMSEFDAEFDLENIQDFQADPLARIELKERLLQIPEAARDVVIATKALGYTYTELAKQTKTNVSMLKSRASRAMQVYSYDAA